VQDGKYDDDEDSWSDTSSNSSHNHRHYAADGEPEALALESRYMALDVTENKIYIVNRTNCPIYSDKSPVRSVLRQYTLYDEMVPAKEPVDFWSKTFEIKNSGNPDRRGFWNDILKGGKGKSFVGTQTGETPVTSSSEHSSSVEYLMSGEWFSSVPREGKAGCVHSRLPRRINFLPKEPNTDDECFLGEEEACSATSDETWSDEEPETSVERGTSGEEQAGCLSVRGQSSSDPVECSSVAGEGEAGSVHSRHELLRRVVLEEPSTGDESDPGQEENCLRKVRIT